MDQKVCSQVGTPNVRPAQMSRCRRIGGALAPSGMVRVRNVVSPMASTRQVVDALQGAIEGPGGKGGRRKRRSVCNGPDRGLNVALPRKGADFRLVLIHDTGAETLNMRGFFGQ